MCTLGLIDDVNQQLLAGLIGQVQQRSEPLGTRTSATLEQVAGLRAALEQAAVQSPEAQLLAEPLQRVRALEVELRTVTAVLEVFGSVEPELIVSPLRAGRCRSASVTCGSRTSTRPRRWRCCSSIWS